MIDRQRLLLPALRRPALRQEPGRDQSARPLLPAGARRPAALLAAGCFIVVAVLGIVSAHQGQGHAIDRAVDSWVVGLSIPVHALSLVSRIGGVTAATLLTAVLAVACLVARRVAGAVLAVTGVALASVVTEQVLKPLVHRTITGNLTYPSGHTTGLFALATALAVVLLAQRSPRPGLAVRVAVVAVAVVIAAAVGAAMVGLRYHYFTDTIGGAAVGTGVVIGVAFLLDIPVIRRWLRWPGR